MAGAVCTRLKAVEEPSTGVLLAPCYHTPPDWVWARWLALGSGGMKAPGLGAACPGSRHTGLQLAALAVPNRSLSLCESHMSGTEMKGPLVLT